MRTKLALKKLTLQEYLTGVGLFFGFTIGVLLLLLGIAGIPFTGGASALPLIVGQGLFIISAMGRGCSIGNYLGKGMDTWSDRDKATNERIAALVGCTLGVIFICFAFPLNCVSTDMIAQSIDEKIANMASFLRTCIFVLQTIGTFASRCANIGTVFDTFFKNKTITDLYRIIKNKFFGPRQKAEDKPDVSVQADKSDVSDQQDQLNISVQQEDTPAPSFKSKVKHFFMGRFKKEERWQKILNILGLIIGITVAVICLSMSVAALPFTGGASSLPAWAAGCLFFFLVSSGFGTTGKYVGRAVDTIVNKDKSSKEKIGAVVGCLLGIGLVIAAFPLHFCTADIIDKSVNAGSAIVELLFSITTIGNLASWCSNLGKGLGTLHSPAVKEVPEDVIISPVVNVPAPSKNPQETVISPAVDTSITTRPAEISNLDYISFDFLSKKQVVEPKPATPASTPESVFTPLFNSFKSKPIDKPVSAPINIPETPVPPLCFSAPLPKPPCRPLPSVEKYFEKQRVGVLVGCG